MSRTSNHATKVVQTERKENEESDGSVNKMVMDHSEQSNQSDNDVARFERGRYLMHEQSSSRGLSQELQPNLLNSEAKEANKQAFEIQKRRVDRMLEQLFHKVNNKRKKNKTRNTPNKKPDEKIDDDDRPQT